MGLKGVLTLLLILLLPVFSFAADVVMASHEALVSSVCYLTEVYLAAGHDALVLEMKDLRKKAGKKVVYSAIQVDGNMAGKVLYHPVPFVTGQNVLNVSDADGKLPGKEALAKAKQIPTRQAIWLDYAINNRLSGERETRFMYCERAGERMICGSYPGNGHLPFLPVHATPACF